MTKKVEKMKPCEPGTPCPECHQPMAITGSERSRWVECCNPSCIACDLDDPEDIPTATACVLCPEVKGLLKSCREFLDNLTTLHEQMSNPTVKQAIRMERALRRLEKAVA